MGMVGCPGSSGSFGLLGLLKMNMGWDHPYREELTSSVCLCFAIRLYLWTSDELPQIVPFGESEVRH